MELVEPMAYQEAWNHPNLKQCMMGIEVIKKEFADMNKKQVWHKIKQDKIPKGRHCVKCK